MNANPWVVFDIDWFIKQSLGAFCGLASRVNLLALELTLPTY
jgi:hypothetical protein